MRHGPGQVVRLAARVGFREPVKGIQRLRDRVVAHFGQFPIHFVAAMLLLGFGKAVVGVLAKQGK